MAFTLGLWAVLAADPARGQDVSQPPDPSASEQPLDQGEVTPEPFDPNMAKLNPGECKKLGRQIVHLVDVAAQANDRGDDLWESSTAARMDNLERRWNEKCGTEDDSLARLTWAAIRTAGRLALKYFSGGYL
jgi:hypothetical protein